MVSQSLVTVTRMTMTAAHRQRKPTAPQRTSQPSVRLLRCRLIRLHHGQFRDRVLARQCLVLVVTHQATGGFYALVAELDLLLLATHGGSTPDDPPPSLGHGLSVRATVQVHRIALRVAVTVYIHTCTYLVGIEVGRLERNG